MLEASVRSTFFFMSIPQFKVVDAFGSDAVRGGNVKRGQGNMVDACCGNEAAVDQSFEALLDNMKGQAKLFDNFSDSDGFFQWSRIGKNTKHVFKGVAKFGIHIIDLLSREIIPQRRWADVREKRTFTVKVEFTPDAIPIEKALDSLAKVIARQMYEEKHGKEGKK